MPPIGSTALACYFRLISLILSLGEMMPICSYYAEKGLIYITIIAPSSRQFFFYTECTCTNIQLSCNICPISNTKYIFVFSCYPYQLCQLLSGNT